MHAHMHAHTQTHACPHSHTHTRTITFLFFILSKSVWTDNRTLVLLNFDVFKALRLCLEHRHSLRSSARMKFVWILFFTGKMGLWLHQRVQRGKGSFDSEAGDSRTFATPRKCSNSLSWLQARIRSGSAKWIHSANQINHPLGQYKPCAWYVCVSASSCHPKKNKLLNTSTSFPYS